MHQSDYIIVIGSCTDGGLRKSTELPETHIILVSGPLSYMYEMVIVP